MMKYFDNRGLEELLAKFKTHLVCWHVGLSLGSFVYFDMGNKLPTKPKFGTTFDIGSTILVLESDKWEIISHGIQIADADTITEDLIDKLIFKYFVGKSLGSLHYVVETKECVIKFSGEITAEEIAVRLKGEIDEDICTMTFPDGSIISCNAKYGFVSDESVAEEHAAIYHQD